MKVRVHPGDRFGVGHVRMIWPAEAAREHCEVEIAPSLPMLRKVELGKPDVIAPGNIDADVVVLQRPSDPKVVSLIPALQARGIAVVVDVDDDLAAIDSRNRASGWENPRMVLRACALADIVTVTTPALAERYGSHGRVQVLRNCVPAALLDMDRTSDGRTVGWGGWTGSHPGDLASTRGGVASAIRDHHGRFQVVGPGDEVRAQLGLDDEPYATGALLDVAGMEFERALGALDVGIVPLADTGFNRAKSGLKGLQYAARGVPFVASPMPEYEALAKLGVGVLAKNRSRNWHTAISRMLAVPELRAELSAQARQVIAEQFTFEGQSWRWAEAWETAIENHRSRPTPTGAQVALAGRRTLAVAA